MEQCEQFRPLQAPVDEEGFVVSFDVEDVAGQRAFFDTYGFVVVRDVLTAVEVEVREPTICAAYLCR